MYENRLACVIAEMTTKPHVRQLFCLTNTEPAQQILLLMNALDEAADLPAADFSPFMRVSACQAANIAENITCRQIAAAARQRRRQAVIVRIPSSRPA